MVTANSGMSQVWQILSFKSLQPLLLPLFFQDVIPTGNPMVMHLFIIVIIVHTTWGNAVMSTMFCSF